MNELALFAGAGGGLLASHILGWRTVCAVENDTYCQRVLLARQKDGTLPPFPIWDDIRTFDGKPWKNTVDVVSGGFPCQDVSTAGNRVGITGEHTALWMEMLRVVTEIQPAFVFAENTPELRANGLNTIISSFTEVGYCVRWCLLGSGHIGSPHRRNRIWIVGYANNQKQRFVPLHATVESSPSTQEIPGHSHPRRTQKPKWWSFADVAGMANGLAHQMDRIRATGNGQVSAVATVAWRILTHDLAMPPNQ